MTRVLHIIPDDGIGGVELAARFAAERANGSIRLLFLDGEPTDPVARMEHAVYARGRPGGLKTALFALTEARRMKPDVIVFSLWKTWLAFLLIRFFGPRARLVIFLHLAESRHAVDAIVTAVNRRLADAVWADSMQTLRSRIGRDADSPKARAISFVLHRPDGQVRTVPAPRLIYWGRIKQQKRIDRAVRLVAGLAPGHPDVSLTLIGPDGGKQAEIRQLADTLGVADRVHFEGPKDFGEITAMAASHSLFVQLSDFEGMAMASVEAMQLGLVPVVTPVGEVARYCRDGENAVIFREEAQTVQDVDALLRDPARFAALSAAAIAEWRNAPMYDEDFIAAARSLASGKA